MNTQPNQPSRPPLRRHPAHPPPLRRHNTPVILHVTICLADRRALLATDAVHDALHTAWNTARAWLVGYYLVMPDHLHLFCAPGDHTPPAVKAWTKYWKRLASQAAPILHGQWLPDCWDTQMRSQEHYARKLEYVTQNPVRKGLVEKSDDWPYQGKIGDLVWISG